MDGAGGKVGTDPKPEETTPTVYRYRVVAGAGETVRLHVGERREGLSVYVLTNTSDSQLAYILNQSGNSAAVGQALAPVLAARRAVADAQAAVNMVNGRLSALRSD